MPGYAQGAGGASSIDVAEALTYTEFAESKARVFEWLEKGGDPNAALDDDGNTFMHHAAANLPSILMEGVRRGGDCNRRNRWGATPLHFAATQWALGPGPQTVRILLRCGSDRNARDRSGSFRFLHIGGNTPLHAIYASVRLSAVEAAFIRNLVGGGKKRFDILTVLLAEADADPNIKNDGGDAPIMLAIREGGTPDRSRTHHLSLFLKHGADPNTRNGKGETPLFEALSLGPSKKYYTEAKQVIEVLLDGGADPDLRDAIGDTPLIRAAKHHEDAALDIGALLDGGADPCLRDRDGKLAYDHASRDSESHLVLYKAGGYTDRDTGVCVADLFEAREAEKKLALDRDKRRRIQSCLARQGFDPGGSDGMFGPRSRAAIRAWQRARGATDVAAAGFLDAGSLEALLAACKPRFDPECTGTPSDTPRGCWLQAEGRSDCWVWNPRPQQDETVSWDGRCKNGQRAGKGTTFWRYWKDGWERWSSEKGRYVEGKSHGHFVQQESDGSIWEGRYENGKYHGLWVQRTSGRGRELVANCWQRGEKVNLAVCVKEQSPARTMELTKAAAPRYGPGPEYGERAAALRPGDKVKVTAIAGDWAWVEHEDGRVGFVRTTMLVEPKVVAVVTEPKCRLSNAVLTAKERARHESLEYKYAGCWLSPINKSNCYLWWPENNRDGWSGWPGLQTPVPGRYSSEIKWLGECQGGVATGMGRLEVNLKDLHNDITHQQTARGRFVGGKAEGKWEMEHMETQRFSRRQTWTTLVFRVSRADGVVEGKYASQQDNGGKDNGSFTGQYLNGERHGRWVRRWSYVGGRGMHPDLPVPKGSECNWKEYDKGKEIRSGAC